MENEFQNRFQQKQKEHHRIFTLGHLGSRSALIDGSRLRADQHDNYHHLHGQSDEHRLSIKLLGFHPQLPQHGLLRGKQHYGSSGDCSVFGVIRRVAGLG